MTLRRTIVASTALLFAACASPSPLTPESSPVSTVTPPHTAQAHGDEAPAPQREGTVRILLAGDVMLGRRVEPVAVAEGPEFMEAIRFVVSSADIAAANLESPLTTRAHDLDNPNVLAAQPELASLLAGAGFDALVLANNHATDSGREGLEDTVGALAAASIAPLGAGPTIGAATSPVVHEHEGVTIAFLAFDATRLALPATDTDAGVASYEPTAARDAIASVRADADVVIVSIHGGVEYLTDRDPILSGIAEDLVEWGADVVWGHGPHVPQPIAVIDGDADRRAVVATSLGNLLFDQKHAATQIGLVLEVLVGADGVIGYRVGRAEHPDLRPSFIGWDPPVGDAALLDGEWWSLIRSPGLAERLSATVTEFPMGDVTVAATGEATGIGRDELVVSYRHPFRTNQSNQVLPARDWTDVSGRSAHLGVFESDTLRPIWAAGTMLRPVADLAVCDGAIALAFDALDDPAIVATGAWIWWDFGFAVAAELPGYGTPRCGDVDRNGTLDPIIVDRTGDG